MAPILLKREQIGTTASGVPTMDPNLLLGALEIGIFVSTMLLGVLIMQGSTYWRRRKDDEGKWGLQLLVVVLLLFEFGHSLACMGTVYYFTVTLSGQPIKPGSSYEFSIALVLGSLIIGLVQLFYVYRCYKFSRNLIISLIGYALVLIHVGCTMWITYESWLAVTDPNPFMIQTDFDWLITVALAGKAVVDVYAAASLGWYLKRSLGGKPFDTSVERLVYGSLDEKAQSPSSTAKLVKRILVWTVETGLITSVASITVLVCFQTMKFNYVWVAVFLSLTKLYSISLISSLNRRKIYRTQYAAVDVTPSMPQSSIRFRSKSSLTRTPVSSLMRPNSYSSGKSQRRWTDAARAQLQRSQIPIKFTGSAIRRSTVSL